jgi:hypothetical protein
MLHEIIQWQSAMPKKHTLRFTALNADFAMHEPFLASYPEIVNYFIKMFCQKKANSDGKAASPRKKLSKKSAGRGIRTPAAPRGHKLYGACAQPSPGLLPAWLGDPGSFPHSHALRFYY